MQSIKLGEALKKAIELEERGYAFYSQCAEKTKNSEGKEMFSYLAREEVKHMEKIRELSEGGSIDRGIVVNIPDMAEVEFDVFERKVPGGEADEEADALGALNIGVRAEKNSIKLYSGLVEQCGGGVCRDFFARLVGEEQKHLSILEAEADSVTETGNFFDFKTVTT